MALIYSFEWQSLPTERYDTNMLARARAVIVEEFGFRVVDAFGGTGIDGLSDNGFEVEVPDDEAALTLAQRLIDVVGGPISAHTVDDTMWPNDDPFTVTPALVQATAEDVLRHHWPVKRWGTVDQWQCPCSTAVFFASFDKVRQHVAAQVTTALQQHLAGQVAEYLEGLT